MLCPCINVVTAYIRPKYRCLPGCLRGEKPPLATGNFSSPWVVLSSSALLLGLLLALLGLLRHMPLLAQQWGQVLAWGWFAPISASSLHYIPIPEVCERYSTDVQRTGRNSQDCSVPKYYGATKVPQSVTWVVMTSVSTSSGLYAHHSNCTNS